MRDPEVATVLRRVPTFSERYLELVEAADGDPGAALVFEELADFTGELLRHLRQTTPCLAQLLQAVEEVASTSPDADELVAGAFLDNLSPDDVRFLVPALGPATRALLDELELPAAATGATAGPAATWRHPCRGPQGDEGGRRQGS